MGIMIFNMGGRPGQAVCKHLFERRGFHVNKLWQTKIIQARTNFSVESHFSFQSELVLKMHFYRLLIQIFQPWLKLRKTAHTALSFSWVSLEINPSVLVQHGLMGKLVVELHMLYPFTVVSFANQTRSALDLSFYFTKLLFIDSNVL